jgi:hypothetical protein
MVVILVAIPIMLLTACTLVRGSGEIVTETREVSNYHRISLSGSGDVIVNQGEQESLTIETDDNVMKHITSEVRDGTLHLSIEENTAIFPTRLIFTVGVEDLTDLSISGSGSIRADGIETERLNSRISGSGEIELDGVASRQDVDVSGSGEYKAGNLRSENVKVSVSGSGNVTVWATETLDSSISGSGSVDYFGSPAVTSSTSGSGQLNSLGEK